MNVLMVAFGSLACPRHGTAVRERVTLNALQELGHDVRIVSTSEPADVDVATELGAPQITVLPREPSFGFSLELVRAVRRAAAGADAIVVGSAMLLPASLIAAPRCPILWDANECETLHYARLPKTFGNSLRLGVWFVLELAAGLVSRRVIVVSDTEAAHWARLIPTVRRKLRVIPHCPLARNPSTPHRPVTASRPRALFVGALGAKHNAAAVRWILDVLAPAESHVELELAGFGMEAVAVDARRAGVTCHGTVSDVDRLILEADVCLAPMGAGAGVKTKILHYLAHGRPVICTEVAAEGVETAPGLKVGRLDQFPRLISEVLEENRDPERAAARQQAQRDWLAKNAGAATVALGWQEALREATA